MGRRSRARALTWCRRPAVPAREPASCGRHDGGGRLDRLDDLRTLSERGVAVSFDNDDHHGAAEVSDGGRGIEGIRHNKQIFREVLKAAKLADLTTTPSAALAEGKRLAVTVAEERELLSPREAAERLGFSAQHVVRLIEYGDLPAEKLAGSSYWKIPLSSILAFEEEREEGEGRERSYQPAAWHTERCVGGGLRSWALLLLALCFLGAELLSCGAFTGRPPLPGVCIASLASREGGLQVFGADFGGRGLLLDHCRRGRQIPHPVESGARRGAVEEGLEVGARRGRLRLWCIPGAGRRVWGSTGPRSCIRGRRRRRRRCRCPWGRAARS